MTCRRPPQPELPHPPQSELHGLLERLIGRVRDGTATLDDYGDLARVQLVLRRQEARQRIKAS
ncbi:MAG TPA: hypothetical protein VK092_05015 [Deinococcales bacterium]|nr:hypothetical protein [Deinococcales bacterium]